MMMMVKAQLQGGNGMGRWSVAADESRGEHSLKARVAVIGRDAAEVVRFAGGWLFDQSLAGWDVNALILDDGDVGSLRILGANVHDLTPMLAPGVAVGQCLHAVVVTAELYEAEEGVRRLARNAQEWGKADLLVWGDPAPGKGMTRHQLSYAARAFKAQALAAAQVPDADALVAESEVFRSVTRP
jgi:hypothetical protein